MVINTDSLFQWLVAAVGGVISVLVTLAIRANYTRYQSLNERLTKVEDRMNTAIPESIQTIHTKIAEIEGSIKEVNTRVALISDAVIQRVDRLETDMPHLMKTIMTAALNDFYRNNNSSDSNRG